MTRLLPVLTLTLAVTGISACGRTGPAEDGTAAPAAAGTAAGGLTTLAAILPTANDVAGWEVTRAPRSFTPDNLWELIDGAADGFLNYGVEGVVTAEYRQPGTGYEAVVEVYQMKDPLNAWGKYAEERNPGYDFLEVGNEGYSGGSSVNFWKGRYYVKMTTFQEKPETIHEVVELGKAVAAKIGAGGAEPIELSWFPKKNQVPHATLYVPKDVLAQSYLSNGFEARYKAGATEYKLILIGMENESAATDALKRYREYVATGGKDLHDLRGPAQGGFAGKDGFYGNLAAIRAGRHLLVSLGAPSEETAIEQLRETAAVISHQGR
ncbi:MAG: DUF6599 family protein [Vicinamibacterales bacterium]